MGADPDYFIRFKLAKTEQGAELLRRTSPTIRCFLAPPLSTPCEDYRATYGVDFEMDKVDFAAGTKIACPALILWGATGAVGRNHKPAEVWANTRPISAAPALPCRHYLSEEAPEETYAELRAFFREGGCDRNPHERVKSRAAGMEVPAAAGSSHGRAQSRKLAAILAADIAVTAR